MVTMHDISASVQSGESKRTEDLVKMALQENYSPEVILKNGLVPGFMEQKKKYRKNEIMDAEILISERAIKAGFRALKPVLENISSAHAGTVITGTFEGDLRDTEKNIILYLMKSLNIQVCDLGTSVSSINFINTAMEKKAGLIVGVTSLTTFLPQMKSLVQAAAQANIRPKTKILLTGGPVTEGFCKSIEADYYAPNLIMASEMAASLCRQVSGRL